MNFIIWSVLLLLFLSSGCSLAHHDEPGDLRNEEFTSLGKKVHEGEIKFHSNNSLVLKVMTYNVLAQTQVEANQHLYNDNDIDALKWENRWPLIYSKIKHEDPHILCLQELDSVYISSHYAKLFELGYSWVFKKNTGAHEDGVAVFYKSDLFEDEAHSQVELNQGVEPLIADKVGVVTRLRVKHAPHHAVVVATAHLVFNTRSSVTRLAQAQVMLAEIERLAYNRISTMYYPVILTGDFNLQPNSGVYRFITEGHLEYEGLSRETLEPSRDNSSLSRDLLPCHLGVTDKSQHVDVVEARVRGEDAAATRLYHREYNINPHQDSSNCSKDIRFSSGTVSHGFNFKSVYPHKQPGNKLEASTNHFNRWITVDYIFYSTLKVKETPQKEAPEKETPQTVTTQKEIPPQETPQKETPQKETPQKETPQKETPQKETPQTVTTQKETPPQETPQNKTPQVVTTQKETPPQETPQKETQQKTHQPETPQKENPQKEPLELLSWERLPTQDELTSHIQHLPDSSHGSDHLPLTATFLLHLD